MAVKELLSAPTSTIIKGEKVEGFEETASKLYLYMCAAANSNLKKKIHVRKILIYIPNSLSSLAHGEELKKKFDE